jgi:hypothetical protein
VVKKIGEGKVTGCLFANLFPASFLAILPVEDGHPGKDARQQPPGGSQDQKKEKDPGTKS